MHSRLEREESGDMKRGEQMKGVRGDENPNWLLNCSGAAVEVESFSQPVRDLRAVPTLSPPLEEGQSTAAPSRFGSRAVFTGSGLTRCGDGVAGEAV